nr:TatD family hydrolase [uncultured Carboxylicivirga sp.]
MIDTHSHIYSEEFDQDRLEIIKAAREVGVKKILLPNVDASSIERMHQTESEFPEMCTAMMGVHPTSVKEDYKKELEIVKHWLDKRSYIAVGEIGIDLYWDKTFLKEQMEVFEQQIIWAKELDLPIVIHCRDAFPEVFEVVEKQLDEKLKGVFHSFTGDINDAKRILEYGSFMMGINGVVTFKNTHLRDVLKEVPLNKLVLETDAPYLAPVPYRGKRNQPAYIEKVAHTLSQVYEMPLDLIIAHTSDNASHIFNI